MLGAAKVNAQIYCVYNDCGLQRYKSRVVSGVFIISFKKRNQERQS